MTTDQLQASPDFWWLRLKYALRDGNLDEAAEAKRRLSAFGVEVRSVRDLINADKSGQQEAEPR